VKYNQILNGIDMIGKSEFFYEGLHKVKLTVVANDKFIILGSLCFHENGIDI
jgi:hypothetical protein